MGTSSDENQTGGLVFCFWEVVHCVIVLEALPEHCIQRAVDAMMTIVVVTDSLEFESRLPH